MLQSMKSYQLERRTVTRNAWNEDVVSYTPVGDVEVAVSVATGATVTSNEVLKVKSSHRGLTLCDVRVGDRFGGFTVDYVTDARQYRLLYLSKEEAVA